MSIIRPTSVLSILVAMLSMALNACGDPVKPDTTMVPTDEVFWSLTLNHKAVNLSTTAPYDTLTLVAIPRNIHGTPLPDVPPASFRAADSAVFVFPNGRIQARRQQPSAEGTAVIATLTYQGVTRVDTAYVTVTNTASPPLLQKFAFEVQPTDSTRLAAEGFSDVASRSLPLIVQDTAGKAIPRLNVFYESSDPTVATVHRQTGLLSGKTPGTVVIRATTMVYGITRKDSIVFTITDPLTVVVLLQGENGVAVRSHLTYTISPGGTVLWFNASPSLVDIVFDQPEAAQKAQGVLGALVADTTGNIAPWGADPGDNNIQHVARGRSFPTPGIYQYHSTRESFSGTIIVR